MRSGRTLATLAFAGAATLGTAKADSMDWQEYNNHFYALTPTTMSWTDSELYAQSQGGYIATINDVAEENWLQETFNIQFHIGLHQPNPTPETEPDGGWEWISGQPVTYTNWGAGEPNNFSGAEHYAVSNVSLGLGWNDISNANIGYHGLVESSVPEPSALALLGLGTATLLHRRKRK